MTKTRLWEATIKINLKVDNRYNLQAIERDTIKLLFTCPHFTHINNITR